MQTSADRPARDARDAALLRVSHLVMEYPASRRSAAGAVVHAVSDVSFEIRAGETLALVGESGSGKSTLARAITQIPRPTSGTVMFRGHELTALRGRSLRQARTGLQMIFQDPFASLDPHWSVLDLIAEPMRLAGERSRSARLRRAREMLDLVQLDPAVYGGVRPRQLSGGQCQRVAIARALVRSPSLIICDEPVSSLDVSIQAQILTLFDDLRRRFALSYLFITHDLAVAKHMGDRVAVMYLGKLCEVGPADDIYRAPRHPYTGALLSAIPAPGGGRQRVELGGEPPSPVSPPSGCRFRTRCPRAQQRCSVEEPPLAATGTGHLVACHFPLQSADEPPPAGADTVSQPAGMTQPRAAGTVGQRPANAIRRPPVPGEASDGR